MKWNDGRWVFFLLLLSSLYWYFEFLNRVHCGPLFVDCYGECRHDTPFFLYSHLWKNIRTDQRSQRADTYRSAAYKWYERICQLLREFCLDFFLLLPVLVQNERNGSIFQKTPETIPLCTSCRWGHY